LSETSIVSPGGNRRRCASYQTSPAEAERGADGAGRLAAPRG